MSSAATGLSANKLTISYGSNVVVKNLDLAIRPRSFTALLGPNGCGKSSILRSLGNIQRVQHGAVLLDGTPIGELPSKTVARRIGFLAQGAPLMEGMSVIELVRQGRYPHRAMFSRWGEVDTLAVEEALHLTGLMDLRDRHLATLSGGQRQRAWVAMTLAQQSSILLLDEPTTYLDLAHQIEVLELMRSLIRNQGRTVVAVLHDLNHAARYADHLVLLRGGVIAGQGTPSAVLTPTMIQEVFDVAVAVINDPETDLPLCIPRRIR